MKDKRLTFLCLGLIIAALSIVYIFRSEVDLVWEAYILKPWQEYRERVYWKQEQKETEKKQQKEQEEQRAIEESHKFHASREIVEIKGNRVYYKNLKYGFTLEFSSSAYADRPNDFRQIRYYEDGLTLRGKNAQTIQIQVGTRIKPQEEIFALQFPDGATKVVQSTVIINGITFAYYREEPKIVYPEPLVCPPDDDECGLAYPPTSHRAYLYTENPVPILIDHDPGFDTRAPSRKDVQIVNQLRKQFFQVINTLRFPDPARNRNDPEKSSK